MNINTFNPEDVSWWNKIKSKISTQKEEDGGVGASYQFNRLDHRYPGPRDFWDEKRERKKQREKSSGSGRCESHYDMLR